MNNLPTREQYLKAETLFQNRIGDTENPGALFASCLAEAMKPVKWEPKVKPPTHHTVGDTDYHPIIMSVDEKNAWLVRQYVKEYTDKNNDVTAWIIYLDPAKDEWCKVIPPHYSVSDISMDRECAIKLCTQLNNGTVVLYK